MSRNTILQVLRGIKSNAPALLQGESYFCTDAKQWLTGTSSGNQLMAPFPVLDILGVIKANVHLVSGQVTTTSKTVPVVITLSNGAVYTNASSYIVLAQSNAGHLTTTLISGSSFSFVTGSIGDVINYICIGN